MTIEEELLFVSLLSYAFANFNPHYEGQKDGVAWGNCTSILNINIGPEKWCEEAVDHICVI